MADDQLTPEQAEAIAESFAKRAASADSMQRSLAAELALLNEESEVFQTIGQEIDTNNSLLKIEAQMAQTQIKSLKNQLEHKIKIGSADEEALKSIGEQIAAQKKLVEETNRRVTASETLQSTTAGMVTTLTGIDSSWKQTFVGSFTESLSTATSLSQVIGDVGAGLSKTLTASNVLGSSLSKVMEATAAMAVMQDEATAAFSKTTGTGKKYHSMITDVAQSNRAFGVSSEDSSNAFNLLYTNMNQFSSMAPTASKELATLVTRLEAVGLSAETVVGNLDFAMRILGMSTAEASKLQLQLLTTADALALPPQTVAEGFANASGQLAAHGGKIMNVFKRMAHQSKATGVAMETLLGFASQFNTYEGSARVVADFNHLLGGPYLNSLELLNATESERIDIIQQAIKSSGQQFEEMDAHTKRAFAHHLGLKDVEEAQRLLTPLTLEAAEANRKKAITDKELADRAQVTQSVLTKLKNAAITLAVGIMPLIQMVSSAVGWITKLNDKTTTTVAGFQLSLIPAIILGVVALKGLGLVLGLVTGAKVAWTAATAGASLAQFALNIVKGIGNFLLGTSAVATVTDTAAKVTNTAATGAQAAAQKTANTTAASGIKTMLAFAGAVALMGVGVGAAAAGIGFMADGFAKLNPTQMNGVLIVLGGLAAVILLMGALMLSPVGAGATLGILGLGAAILLLGAGVAVAALGISVLMKSMSSVDPATILAAGTAFAIFATSLVPLIPWVLTGPLLAAVLLAIGTAAIMIGTGFALAAKSISEFDNLLSNISSDAVGNLTAIANEVERIVDSINSMSTIKAVLFENIVTKLSPETSQIPSSRTTAAVNAGGVARAQNGVRAPTRTTESTTNSQNVRPVEIVVKVSEKEIARIAWKEIQKELDRVGGRQIHGPRVG